MTSLFEDIFEEIEDQLNCLTEKHKISENDESVISIKNTCNICKTAFKGFRTSNEILEYYEVQDGYVKPIETFLGFRWDLRLNSQKKLTSKY